MGRVDHAPRWLNWTVQTTESGRYAKVDGMRKWTVLKSKSGRFEKKQLVDLKNRNWTVVRDESRRPRRIDVDGPKH